MSLVPQIVTIIHRRLEVPGELEVLVPHKPLFVPIEHGGLGIDSVAALDIIAALADHFDLPFDDVQPTDVFSIAALAAYIERHLPEKATP